MKPIAIALLLTQTGCESLKKYFANTERSYGVYYLTEGGGKFGVESTFRPTGKSVVRAMK